MLRFSYEWIEGGYEESHWSDELYAIYDAKHGYTDPFAWTWTRDAAERIVDALNATEAKQQMKTDSNDLSDLLD